MQKVYFLPDGHTDFIFAHICEELGLIGGLCVLGIFATFTLIGVVTALRMPDFLGSLLACGLTLMLVVPAMMNIMVVTGMLPTKGLALPMVSYGGSQMLVNLTAVGILTNIVYHRQRTVDGRRRRRA
jgi:cell division protein FtsW